MNTSEESNFAYDQVLYPNYLHTQTHPDRLATMTKFFGVNPQPVENCRVLELGCGTGSSLLSFAFDLPGSEFIGVDLSAKQIALGNVAIKAIGIKNLTLRQADIMQITRDEYGEFDYIIAHGLYSWVPAPVRDQILNICRETLAPQGVAYVSYNALPGCHFRQMAREMMMFHTRDLTSPIEKVNQSLGLLEFIAEAAPPTKQHKQVLQYELEKLKERNYENIFHDDLANFNHPVYFHQFVSHADRYDLQFVTESEYFTGKNVNFSQEVLQIIHGISDDELVQEQYIDFITGRRFRQTLVCRKEINVSRTPDSKILRSVRLATPLRPLSETIEVSTDRHEVFAGQKNEKIEINNPLAKAAIFYLGEHWVRSVTFEELIAAARQILSEESGAAVEISEKDEQILNEILFLIFCSGLLRLESHEPVFATTVSEKPQASPIARWEAQNTHSISTLLCTSVIIKDKLGRELIKLLDGTRDRTRLVADLTGFINSVEFDQPTEIKKTILRELPDQLEKNLSEFAGMGLLIS